MSEHVPDKWQIVRIKVKQLPITYKVFACWHGDHLNGDSWQMNSGITSAKKIKDYWIFKGFSGSIYKCYVERYGSNLYGEGILNSLIEKAKENGASMWAMPESLDWSKFQYEKE